MQENKDRFTKDTAEVFCELSRLLFNAQSDHELVNMVGLSKEEIESTTKKLTHFLPSATFSLEAKQLKEVQNICARELVFFQVQEKNSKGYDSHLEKFLQRLARDIERRFHIKNTSAMKEE